MIGLDHPIAIELSGSLEAGLTFARSASLASFFIPFPITLILYSIYFKMSIVYTVFFNFF
mgnify:CR=1 FL=1